MPNWRIRVNVLSVLTVPNVELLTVVMGGAKFGWLKTFNASARICTFIFSRSLM
jgi:hypothetical protein